MLVVYMFSVFFMIKYYYSVEWTQSIRQTFVHLFVMMIGGSDMDDLINQGQWEMVAIGLAFIMLTNIVMLSLLVALLTDVYASVTKQMQVEYRKIVLQSMKFYVPDTIYGGLTCLFQPFSIVNLVLFPFYFNKTKAEKISNALIKLVYIIIILPIASLIFMAFNLSLMIPTYLCNFIYFPFKTILIGDENQSKEIKNNIKTIIFRAFFWLIFGIFVLLIVLFKDFYYFLLYLCEDPTPDILAKKTFMVDNKNNDLENDIKHFIKRTKTNYSVKTDINFDFSFNDSTRSFKNVSDSIERDPTEKDKQEILKRLSFQGKINQDLVNNMLFQTHFSPYLTKKIAKSQDVDALKYINIQLVHDTMKSVKNKHKGTEKLLLDMKQMLKKLIKQNNHRLDDF